MSVAGKQVAVLGGDRRMNEAAAQLAAAGAWVRAAHVPEDPAPPGVMRCPDPGEALSGAEALLLPVQAVGDEGRVYTEPPTPPLYLRPEHLDRLAPGALVFAGLAGGELRRWTADRELHLVEYRERDDFAILNSVPSAEGAIGMAMAASPLCLFDTVSLVLGYGRTGVTLARMLQGIGARVAVAARPQVDLARIYAAGHRPVPLDRLAESAAEADFIFNTIPALVLTREVLAAIPRHTVIVDLASSPGGTDFAAANQMGLKALLAPGLPGKVAPVSAGRIIAGLVVSFLATPAGAPVPVSGGR